MTDIPNWFYEKARYIGLEAIAPTALLEAITEPGSRILIVAKSTAQVKTIFNMIADLFKGYPHREGLLNRHISQPYPRLGFKNGSDIIGRTADNDGCSIRGFDASSIYLNEPREIGWEIISSVIMPILYTCDGVRLQAYMTSERFCPSPGLSGLPRTKVISDMMGTNI